MAQAQSIQNKKYQDAKTEKINNTETSIGYPPTILAPIFVSGKGCEEIDVSVPKSTRMT